MAPPSAQPENGCSLHIRLSMTVQVIAQTVSRIVPVTETSAALSLGRGRVFYLHPPHHDRLRGSKACAPH